MDLAGAFVTFIGWITIIVSLMRAAISVAVWLLLAWEEEKGKLTTSITMCTNCGEIDERMKI